jgi:hypothetical protein
MNGINNLPFAKGYVEGRRLGFGTAQPAVASIQRLVLSGA